MRAALALAMLSAGCEAATPPEPLPETFSYLFTAVPWVEGSGGKWLLLDTGTPHTQLLPETVGDPAGSFDVRPVPSEVWDAAGLNPGDVPLVVSDQVPTRMQLAMDDGDMRAVGGILGADLLARTPVTLDPASSRFTTGVVARTETAIEVPIDVLGAGTDCYEPGRCVDSPPSRIVGTTWIGDRGADFFLDTASTYTVTTRTVLGELAARAGVPIVRHEDSLGEIWLARLPSLRVGEAEARDVIVAAPPGIDVSLARARIETGRPVEVVLGQSFLAAFVTTVDYGGGRLVLDPYADPALARARNLGKGIGVGLRKEGDCLEVTIVTLDGSTDLARGDCVEAVDDLVAAEGASVSNVGAHVLSLPFGTEVVLRVRPDRIVTRVVRDLYE